jgi:hypothetical protein
LFILQSLIHTLLRSLYTQQTCPPSPHNHCATPLTKTSAKTRASSSQTDASNSCVVKFTVWRDAQSQRIELQKASHDGESYKETFWQNSEGRFVFPMGAKD